MIEQHRECILRWNEANGTYDLLLLDGEKVVWKVVTPITQETLEPTYETSYNMGVRANQEMGLNAQGEKIDE